MNTKIIISFFLGLALAMCSAYPQQDSLRLDKNQFKFDGLNKNDDPNRRFSLDGTTIGGSRGQGFDVNANGRFPIWSSQNGRNTFDGTAGYSQHLGGPWGNSRPDYRGGVIFTHRF